MDPIPASIEAEVSSGSQSVTEYQEVLFLSIVGYTGLEEPVSKNQVVSINFAVWWYQSLKHVSGNTENSTVAAGSLLGNVSCAWLVRAGWAQAPRDRRFQQTARFNSENLLPAYFSTQNFSIWLLNFNARLSQLSFPLFLPVSSHFQRTIPDKLSMIPSRVQGRSSILAMKLFSLRAGWSSQRTLCYSKSSLKRAFNESPSPFKNLPSLCNFHQPFLW